MLTESFGRSTTENHSGRDKQVPAVKDCRFTQTAFSEQLYMIQVGSGLVSMKQKMQL